jgi:hypothetical protein
MKIKSYVLFFLLINTHSSFFAQKSNRLLHEIIIVKGINVDNKINRKVLKIDSKGGIYLEGKKIEPSFAIKQFTREINNYIAQDSVERYPGNNNPPNEAATPNPNQQSIYISVTFKDDVDKEKDLKNKTSYRWGGLFDRSKNDYPLFKYLTEKEASVLKNLLE